MEVSETAEAPKAYLQILPWGQAIHAAPLALFTLLAPGVGCDSQFMAWCIWAPLDPESSIRKRKPDIVEDF